jgi:broad specificity phosphatase PhoE
VFGRGNPEEKYIEDVQLDGPIPGVIFDMKAQSPQESGNDKKMHWKSDGINKVVRRLKAEIESIHDAYKTHGLTIITRNVFIDIYLIRHGETDWNSQGKLQGHTDIPLNEKGKLQANQLQEKFADINFIKVFSSDLIRARATAEISLGSKKSTIIETSLLRERFMGPWEGRLVTELRWHLKQKFDLDNLTQEEYLSVKWDDTAESYADVYQRIQTLIRSIAIFPPANNDPILFSSHGGVLKAILYHLDFQPGFHWQVPNGAFLKFRAQADGQIAILASDGIKLIEIKDNTGSF